MDPFDCISPIDYRYRDKEIAKYLSENGFVRYKLMVECALIRSLQRYGLCPASALEEIEAACEKITAAEVYKEEKRIQHDIKALVNCIRARVSDRAKPYVHLMATSQDIIDSANAGRMRDVVKKVLIPSLCALEKVLIAITLREAKKVQIGRTHGQHAVPITFGFAMAEYVSRLGASLEYLRALADTLPGKFSGAVGSYNAQSLLMEDPETFEKEMLADLGLAPAEHATQIVPPDARTRLFCEVTITAGILANLADDVRHLQRTEIGEVQEEFGEEQIGSSTMPHKQNPITFENAKSLWKIVMPRIITLFMDQLSEHQRDLTNSASQRTYGEIIAYVVAMTKHLTAAMEKLSYDENRARQNLWRNEDIISAEPLYIVLAAGGHPDAHEKIRALALRARKESTPLWQLAYADPELKKYLANISENQRGAIKFPFLYTGIAAKKAIAVANRWKKKLEEWGPKKPPAIPPRFYR